MPVARPVMNAFTAKEVSDITGLSLHMLNYLRKMGFLAPAYDAAAPRRGKVRYYSYRDLIAAKLVQKLRSAGVEIGVLKFAIAQLMDDRHWEKSEGLPDAQLRWLITDGVEVYVNAGDGYLDVMSSSGQRAFGFLVNVGTLAAEVHSAIPIGEKRDNFSLLNAPIRFSRRA